MSLFILSATIFTSLIVNDKDNNKNRNDIRQPTDKKNNNNNIHNQSQGQEAKETKEQKEKQEQEAKELKEQKEKQEQEAKELKEQKEREAKEAERQRQEREAKKAKEAERQRQEQIEREAKKAKEAEIKRKEQEQEQQQEQQQQLKQVNDIQKWFTENKDRKYRFSKVIGRLSALTSKMKSDRNLLSEDDKTWLQTLLPENQKAQEDREQFEKEAEERNLKVNSIFEHIDILVDQVNNMFTVITVDLNNETYLIFLKVFNTKRDYFVKKYNAFKENVRENMETMDKDDISAPKIEYTSYNQKMYTLLESIVNYDGRSLFVKYTSGQTSADKKLETVDWEKELDNLYMISLPHDMDKVKNSMKEDIDELIQDILSKKVKGSNTTAERRILKRLETYKHTILGDPDLTQKKVLSIQKNIYKEGIEHQKHVLQLNYDEIVKLNRHIKSEKIKTFLKEAMKSIDREYKSYDNMGDSVIETNATDKKSLSKFSRMTEYIRYSKDIVDQLKRAFDQEKMESEDGHSETLRLLKDIQTPIEI
jgi:acyl transferase domain-containing protein